MEKGFKINDTVNKKSGRPFKNGSHIQTIVGFGINCLDPKKRPCGIFDDGSICNLDMLNHVIMFDIETSNGGYEKGELPFVLGVPFGIGKTTLIEKIQNNELVKFIPIEGESNYSVVIEDICKKLDTISIKQSFDVINKMLDTLKKDSAGKIISSSVTKHEKIGEMVYPVTYHENGMVTVDYPLKFDL